MSKKNRVRVRHLSKKDFKQEFFCTGGPGGQNQNRKKNGVRIRHPESGAVEESRVFKSREQNRRACMLKFKGNTKFLLWARMEVAKSLGQDMPEEIVEKAMKNKADFRVEVKDENGRWVEVPWSSIVPDANLVVRLDGTMELHRVWKEQA